MGLTNFQHSDYWIRQLLESLSSKNEQLFHLSKRTDFAFEQPPC